MPQRVPPLVALYLWTRRAPFAVALLVSGAVWRGALHAGAADTIATTSVCGMLGGMVVYLLELRYRAWLRDEIVAAVARRAGIRVGEVARRLRAAEAWEVRREVGALLEGGRLHSGSGGRLLANGQAA